MTKTLYVPRIGHYNLPWIIDAINKEIFDEVYCNSNTWVDFETGEILTFVDQIELEAAGIKIVSKAEFLYRFLLPFRRHKILVLHGYGNLAELLTVVICRLFLADVWVRGEFHDRRSESKVRRVIRKFVYSIPSGFLPISKEGESFLYSFTRNKKISSLPYISGVTEKESHFAITEDRSFDFLFVGKLIERKGIKNFLDALDHPKFQNKKICIVGDGPLREYVNERTKGKNWVVMGRLPPKEVLAIMRDSKVLVLPSLFDTWGIVTVEALEQGCVVIGSSQVGSVIELTRYNSNVRKFEQADIEDLIEKMSENCVYVRQDIVGYSGPLTIENHSKRLEDAIVC